MNLKKSRKKVFKPLFLPLVGAKKGITKSLKANYGVDKAFRFKYRATEAISFLSAFLSKLDAKRWKSKLIPKADPPVFIIGHWRSGTTLLHNVLCRADLSFVTTYHGVFPNNLFAFKWLFKSFMKISMPGERPSDRVRIHPDYPQEEEIAIGNEMEYSYYYWFYFPRYGAELAKKFLSSNNRLKAAWMNNYRRFVSRALVNKKGRFFISKNPPNTFRIATLLELFPEARFIYLHRNPYEVHRSCKRFFWATLQGIQAQKIDHEAFENQILNVYQSMIETYEKDKKLIPKGQLSELAFDHLLDDPLEALHKLNRALNLGIQEDEWIRMKKYLSHQKFHKVETYKFTEEDVKNVNAHWPDSMNRLGYKQIKAISE